MLPQVECTETILLTIVPEQSKVKKIAVLAKVLAISLVNITVNIINNNSSAGNSTRAGNGTSTSTGISDATVKKDYLSHLFDFPVFLVKKCKSSFN